MNFELIREFLDDEGLRKYKDFGQLPEIDQLSIFLEVRKCIVADVRSGECEIDDLKSDIRDLHDKIYRLEKTEVPIAEEIRKARIRLGIIPVPGQLPLPFGEAS